MKDWRSYTLDALSRYWARNAELIFSLPMPHCESPGAGELPPRPQMVELPEWAGDISVDGGLLVPSHLLVQGEGPGWARIDWLGVIFWYLNGLAERAFEKANGPIHSYSTRLKGWDSRLWQRAWVNRVALFLRRWAIAIKASDENSLFGELPDAKIHLTHDVDAVRKTLVIRCKQAAFHLFNAYRTLVEVRISGALQKLSQALRSTFTFDRYWCFDEIMKLEDQYGLRSVFNFYGGRGGWRRPLKEILIDPGYDVEEPSLRSIIRKLHACGWKIGLHPSFQSWRDSGRILQECKRLENALGAEVSSCRQHWLCFSWDRTWCAQSLAGIRLDSTLGFNDRPGFRNGAAIDFQPLSGGVEKPLSLVAVPMILMDSHLYDYGNFDETCIKSMIHYWVDEIREVRGVGSIIWHQRVFSRDYGWDKGYRILLDHLTGNKASPEEQIHG